MCVPVTSHSGFISITRHQAGHVIIVIHFLNHVFVSESPAAGSGQCEKTLTQPESSTNGGAWMSAVTTSLSSFFGQLWPQEFSLCPGQRSLPPIQTVAAHSRNLWPPVALEEAADQQDAAPSITGFSHASTLVTSGNYWFKLHLIWKHNCGSN